MINPKNGNRRKKWVSNSFPLFIGTWFTPFYRVIDPIARGEYALSIGLMGRSTSLYWVIFPSIFWKGRSNLQKLNKWSQSGIMELFGITSFFWNNFILLDSFFSLSSFSSLLSLSSPSSLSSLTSLSSLSSFVIFRFFKFLNFIHFFRFSSFFL